MNLIKEKLLDMRQIEKLLLKFKKEKIPSDGGENLVNRGKKSEEENNDNNRSSDENEEEEPNSCGEERMEEEHPSEIKIKKTIAGIKEIKQMLQFMIKKKGIVLEFEKEDKQPMQTVPTLQLGNKVITR
ncbi:hypothetical protein JHK85_023182 [Glycine max]|nr:hypothetical protein JHK85_023182 [Glycine max]